MPRFGAASPKEIIGKVAACTEVVAEVDLSGNALFKMKAGEYGPSLASALSHNESVKSVKLRKLELGDADCAWLKTILETSKIAALDLEGNKISSAGAVLLAEGVAGNDALAALNLVGNGPFGESCMDAWLAALEKNVTLVDLKWRLDSRKSFKLNKDLVRNKQIAKRKADGKDVTDLLPDGLKPGGFHRQDGVFVPAFEVADPHYVAEARREAAAHDVKLAATKSTESSLLEDATSSWIEKVLGIRVEGTAGLRDGVALARAGNGRDVPNFQRLLSLGRFG